MAIQEAPPKMDRRTRRRVESRAKLLAAARGLIVEPGINAISIQDITEAADVGLGTFYNHFESKVDILLAVSEELFAAHAAHLDAITEDLDDPAEIVAISYRKTLRYATEPDIWGVIRQLPVDAIRSLNPGPIRDIGLGMESGRFEVDNVAALNSFIYGVGLGVMGDLAAGVISLEDAEHTAVYFLQMLGVSREEALVLAGKPLPD